MKDPIVRTYKFKDYDQCTEFSNFVMGLAKELNHHPEIVINYSTVEVKSISHDEGEVTDRDHNLISKIDQYYSDNYSSSKSSGKSLLKDYDTSLIKIYTDGGSRGNPGPSASGFVIYDANDKIIVRAANYIGITTNNQAEYISIKNALKYASKLSAKEFHAFLDSQLLINQLNGIYKVKNQDLLPIYLSVKELEKTFNKLTFSHVPRENNKVADAMVNESLDKTSDILYT